MAKLRKKAWNLNETTSTVEEDKENESMKSTYQSEHELINVNSDLAKVENKTGSIQRRNVDEISVSIHFLFIYMVKWQYIESQNVGWVSLFTFILTLALKM
jgi:hypothetical protein